jgi:hypothetical protein
VIEEKPMARYYFHIRDHDAIVRDREGREMDGMRDAIQEAEEAAREILAEKVLRSEVIDGQKFEIYDEFGTKLFTVPFKSVLRLG